MSDIVYELELH